MVHYCEYCKKRSTQGQGISMHRFPKDEKLKLQWVKNMGRSNWQPRIGSLLCSEHFEKNCVDMRDVLARLRKGSVPTIFKKDDTMVDMTVQIKEETSCTVKSPDPLDVSIDSFNITKSTLPMVSGSEGTVNFDLNVSATTSIELQPATTIISYIRVCEAMEHDHHYDVSPKTRNFRQELERTKAKLRRLRRENKVLKLKLKRRNNK